MFEERLETIEDAEALGVQAIRAAGNAATTEQARALAVVLARGVLGDEADATQSELLVSVLDGMTKSEIEGLRELSEFEADPVKPGPSAVGVLSRGEMTSTPLAEAVVPRLVGRGLLVIDPVGFSAFGLTSLGEQVLEVLTREHGTT